MRVFCLNTGRCGSVTFARACSWMGNYTSGHETKASRVVGRERVQFPDHHVETDFLLIWYAGLLAETYDDADTVYVHLHRDPEQVAQSYFNLWREEVRWSMMQAFGHAMVIHPEYYTDSEKLDVCRFYVETVEANIRQFLATRMHKVTIELDHPKSPFTWLWGYLEATGSVEKGLAEFDWGHNRRDYLPRDF